MKKIAQLIRCSKTDMIVGKDISVAEVLEADFIVWDYNGLIYHVPEGALQNAKATLNHWYPINQFKIKPPIVKFMIVPNIPDKVCIIVATEDSKGSPAI